MDSKINFDQDYVEEYKRKMKRFLFKGFIAAGVLSVVFGRPKMFFSLGLGLGAGYCNEEFKKIFTSIKENKLDE